MAEVAKDDFTLNVGCDVSSAAPEIDLASAVRKVLVAAKRFSDDSIG